MERISGDVSRVNARYRRGYDTYMYDEDAISSSGGGRARDEAVRAVNDRLVTDLAQGIKSSAFPGTKIWRRLHELVAGGTSFEEIMTDPVGHLGEEGAALRPQQ